MDLTLKGRFLLGLPYQDKLYFEFTVKTLTMGAECAALEVISALNLDPNSTKPCDKTLIDMAYFTEQVCIDGVPKTVLTPQYLLENLATDDYWLAMDMISDLRKKRQDAGECPSPTASR